MRFINLFKTEEQRFKYSVRYWNLMKQKEKKGVSPVCDGCAQWGVFKEKCWFYWELKKECSQFKHQIAKEPKYKEDKATSEWKQLQL